MYLRLSRAGVGGDRAGSVVASNAGRARRDRNAALAWLPSAGAAVGVRPEQLPPVRPAHDVIGNVTTRAADALGLRAGTLVVAGGGDFAAATLGAGVLDEGEACLMLGTAGNLLV